MEIRGMLSNRAVKAVLLEGEWLSVVDVITGEELARVALQEDIRLEEDRLLIRGASITIDRSFMLEAREMMHLVSSARPAVDEMGDSQANFCVQCGSAIGADARFCFACGAPLNTDESVVDPPWTLRANRPNSHPIQEPEWPRGPSEGSVVRSRTRKASAFRVYRNVALVVVATAVVVAVGFAVLRGDDPAGSRNSDVTFESACGMLSKYAYEGIPATYVDEGATLLNSLADDFESIGRVDIAGRLGIIVDLVYEGPAGQVTAKDALIQLATTECGSPSAAESGTSLLPLTPEEVLSEARSSLEAEVGRYQAIDDVLSYDVFAGCGEYQYFAFIKGTSSLWILEYVSEVLDDPLSPDSYRYWDEVAGWQPNPSSELEGIEEVSLTGNDVKAFRVRYRSGFDDQIYGFVVSAVNFEESGNSCSWAESMIVQELRIADTNIVGEPEGISATFSYDPTTGSIYEE